MATATAPAPVKRGTVTPGLVTKMTDIFGVDGYLSTINYERREELALLATSLLSGIDPLFLGDPGVGKTWMIEGMLLCIDGVDEEIDFFNTLVFKETPAQDLLGPMSPAAMKDGRIERMMAGFLPTARVAYLDEVFKGSPTLMNALLDVMAQRKLKVGASVHALKQLLCIFGSSNELPQREDMNPFRDRWGLTKFVQPVRSPEGRIGVMKLQDEYQARARTLDLSAVPKLTLDDIEQGRNEARGIVIPDGIFENMSEAQEKWEAHGFLPSPRRVGQMLAAMKAKAWLDGRDSVTADDIAICQHMAWNNPDHFAKAREVVLEFANVFARKAAAMREGLEPVKTEIDRLQSAINKGGSADDFAQEAWVQMRALRSMKREARDEIGNGDRAGHDVGELRDVLAEMERAEEYVKRTFLDDDE